MRYKDVLLSRKKGRLFSVLLRSMLQSVSADSQIDCRVRIAFWLRTSISLSLSLSISLSLYLFLLLSPHAFSFSFYFLFLSSAPSFSFSNPLSVYLPNLSSHSCKRKLSFADKEYCSCEHCCLEKRMGLWRRECTEHSVTDGLQVAYWSNPKTHQVIPSKCPMDSASWTSVYSTLTDKSVPSFWRPKMQSNIPWCVLIRC